MALALDLRRPTCHVFDTVIGRISELCRALHDAIGHIEHAPWSPNDLKWLRRHWAQIPSCGTPQIVTNVNRTSYVSKFIVKVMLVAKRLADPEVDALLEKTMLLARDEVPALPGLLPYFMQPPHLTKWDLMRLGSDESLGLVGLKWTARDFDCRATHWSFPRGDPLAMQVRRSCAIQSSLSMDEIDWKDLTWFSPQQKKVRLPFAAVRYSREICTELQQLLSSDFQGLLALQRKWASRSSAGEVESQDLVPWQPWLSRQRPVLARGAAANSTLNFINFRLKRMIAKGHLLEDSEAAWQDFVAGQIVLTLEALFSMQFLNAYATVHPSVADLAPRLHFFDVLGDRVAVVLAAIGEDTQNPFKLLVEVGVFRGFFALNFVKRCAMKYVGFDDYYSNVAEGIFENTKELYQRVRSQLKELAGERAELYQIASQDSGSVLLPSDNGLADYVLSLIHI